MKKNAPPKTKPKPKVKPRTNRPIPRPKPPKSKPKPKDDCFITTACVHHYSLPDNCYQLNTLRSFRDSYLRTQKGGDKLIQQYYAVAPTLVKLLNKHPEKDHLFKEIFRQINLACVLIDKRENEKAKTLYIKVVTNLLNQFDLL